VRCVEASRGLPGESLCCFLGLAGSMLGWLPALTGMPQGWFLVGAAVAGLVMAWQLTRT